MTVGVKRAAAALAITYRMGRIAMCAGYPIAREWFSRGMRPAICEQFGQNMSVRTFRALPVGRRNSLKDLHATQLANKNTMRVGVQNNRHSAAIGCEYRFPDMPPQCGGGSRVTDADESINLQQSKPKIEKDSTSILRS